MSSQIERAIARLAPHQHGLVTRTQLRGAGIPARSIDYHVATGRIERVHPGVYRHAAVPRSWLQTVLAATLSAGEGAAASGLTAARLWDLHESPGQVIEVTVLGTAHPRSRGFVVHRSRRPFSPAIVNAIPTTPPARTLDDLARVLPERVLEELLDKALYRRLVRPSELAGARGALGRLVRARDGAQVESVLETRFVRLVRTHGLPPPVPQFEIRRGGTLLARVDFAYPLERVAIEIDGFRYHAGRSVFDGDRRRQNDVLSAGFAVLRFTAADLARPRRVAAMIRRVLWERGCPGVASV